MAAAAAAAPAASSSAPAAAVAAAAPLLLLQRLPSELRSTAAADYFAMIMLALQMLQFILTMVRSSVPLCLISSLFI